MKWFLFLTVIVCTIWACSTETGSKDETISRLPTGATPTFNSQKFDTSFTSSLPEETLRRAQAFVDAQVASVTLFALLPDCRTIDSEKRCYETSVLTTSKGDSLNTKHLSNIRAINIDEDRLGVRKTLRQDDIKKLLPPLFTGAEKEVVSFCYLPRHAIALYDENALLTGFIEICFECSKSIVILDSLNLPPLNQQALNELGALFLAYDFEEKTSL